MVIIAKNPMAVCIWSVNIKAKISTDARRADRTSPHLSSRLTSYNFPYSFKNRIYCIYVNFPPLLIASILPPSFDVLEPLKVEAQRKV